MPYEFNPEVLNIITSHIRHEVGRQIREARKQAGMSQAKLAELLSRRQAYISDLENGKAEPNATLIVQLAYIFHKPVAFFFPPEYRDFQNRALTREELSIEEQELIARLRGIHHIFDPQIVMHLVNALADYAERMDEAFRNDTPSDEEIEYHEWMMGMDEANEAQREELKLWREFMRQRQTQQAPDAHDEDADE